jgi:hypothetical protein
MQIMSTVETLRGLRLIRAYTDEVAADRDNPRREEILRNRIERSGFLDEGDESMRDDPVIHSPKQGG